MGDFLYWWPAALIPAGWIPVCFLIARLGGWASLAKFYLAPDTAILDGESWSFQSLQMRWATNYGNCVTVRATPLGLGLSVIWLLRFGHPPLFMPWSDVIVQRGKKSRFYPSMVELRFRSEPSIPVRVSKKLFSKILDSADPCHPELRRAYLRLDLPPSDPSS